MIQKCVLLVPFIAALALLAGAPAHSFGQAERNQHALLVGCTAYPNLAKRLQLDGPANDVVLFKKLLVERFSFPDENVTILAEDFGENQMPTRANIERQWRRLAEVAQQGDQIVVMMAGHGSQAPQLTEDPDNLESDGLDELFLPRDVGPWSDQTGEVKNSIKDDDIREWVAAIADKGASLWVIVDACHSGTMTRGAGGEVKRELPPEALGIPKTTLQKAYAIANKQRASDRAEETQLLDRPEKSRGLKGSTPAADPNRPAVVALYASQSIEPTVERELPDDSADRKYYGLLTYTLTEVLSQAESKLTYRELVGQIHRQYVKMGRTSPTPLLEGTDIDREVLGLREFPRRSSIVLSEGDDDGSWKINAGALSGLTAGSILALNPPAGTANADQVVGHVCIAEDGIEALEAVVEPCEYDGMPAPNELATGMRGKTVYFDYGDQRLKIAVDPQTDEGEPAGADQCNALEGLLQEFASENAHLVQLASVGADWQLRYDSVKSKQLFLVPAEGWQGQDEGDKLPPLFGPAPTDQLASWLDESLTRIARAQTLLRVAGQGIEDSSDLDVRIVRFQDRRDKVGEPVEFGRGEVKLYDGDLIEFQVENMGFDPLDVTVLMVDSGFGIEALFPNGTGQSNRLHAGDNWKAGGKITLRTTGLERVVVIAVKRKELEQHVKFAFLSQPTLERAERSRGNGGDDPLASLLTGAMFGAKKETTRGFEPDVVENYQIHTRTWKTVPTRRPK